MSDATSGQPQAAQSDGGGQPARSGIPWLIVGAVLTPMLLAALAVTLFAWPSARLGPRGLPVGVTGPDAAALGHALGPDGFDVHVYPSRAAVATAIRHRAIYGGFVTGPGRPQTLTASAASPAVAKLLTAAGQAGVVEEQAGPQVIDVVPADRNDPNQGVLASALLPMVLAGEIGGIFSWLVARKGPRGRSPARFVVFRAGELVVAAVAAGLAATGLMQGWLAALPGNWAANAAVFSLTILAISGGVAGLSTLLGYSGIGIASLLMVLLGNAFSAAGSAPQMLPAPAGVIGQLLPPGAGATLLRSTAFFGGYGAGGQLTALALWAGLGLAVMAAITLRPSRA